MLIRPETASDVLLVRALDLAAFGGPVEAGLVDALRERARPLISLVAEDGPRPGGPDAPQVVGHILFSPAALEADPGLPVMGLAPMAVAPSHQRQGIGSALVREGLEQCRRLGAVAVIVLGHPAYYPRFGFRPASQFGVRSEYDVPDDVFMALELKPGALAGRGGLVRYHPAFAEL